MTRVLLDPAVVRTAVLAALALLALWAFVSYLQPAFSGELVRELLRCN